MKLGIPKTVTNAILLEFAQPNEMWMVRVLLSGVVNRTDYTVRGKNKAARTYKAKYDDVLRCHTLDVPLSVWNAGVPQGTYRANESVMHDIMGGRNNTLLPVITYVVPFPGSEARHTALAHLLAGEAELAKVPVNTDPSSEPEKPSGKSAAERMAAMRERKKQLAAESLATA